MRLSASLSRFILKVMLKLPDSWLLKLSGKPPGSFVVRACPPSTGWENSGI